MKPRREASVCCSLVRSSRRHPARSAQAQGEKRAGPRTSRRRRCHSPARPRSRPTGLLPERRPALTRRGRAGHQPPRRRNPETFAPEEPRAPHLIAVHRRGPTARLGPSHRLCLMIRNVTPGMTWWAWLGLNPRTSSLSGIIASEPPSLGTLADCIIALSAAERGLARHYRGGPEHRPVHRPGILQAPLTSPTATLEPGVSVHWRSNDHFASRNACQAREA